MTPAKTTPPVAPAANDQVTDHSLPLLPGLLLYGRTALSTTMRSWWKRWAKRTANIHPGVLLGKAARDNEGLRPAGALSDWLRHLGWEGGQPSASDVQIWLGRWTAEQDQRRLSRLTPWQRVPTAARTPLAQRYQIARELFSKAVPLTGIRTGDGTWVETTAKVDDELWDSQADIWGTVPGLPPEALRLLRIYFTHRGRANLPRRPAPTRVKLCALILAPAGSAPGVGGEPREAYHIGSRFVAALLAQGTYAADMSDELLCLVLGPSVDLLVWIPKHPGAEWPSELGPLQLPACFRRLSGAIMADLAGPEIESQLSLDQAAVKGGQCGPNITLANGHLSTRPGPPPSRGMRGPCSWHKTTKSLKHTFRRWSPVLDHALPPLTSMGTRIRRSSGSRCTGPP